jgi:hypothetical protein
MAGDTKKKIEEQIKKLGEMSESVTWNNAGETLQEIGDDIDSFLILHSAALRQILNELKKLW